jgi:hypothetical protein
MTTRNQLLFERFDALLRMFVTDGATPRGSMPPIEHVEAIQRAGEPNEMREVARAHAEGRGPPTDNGPPTGVGGS